MHRRFLAVPILMLVMIGLKSPGAMAQEAGEMRRLAAEADRNS